MLCGTYTCIDVLITFNQCKLEYHCGIIQELSIHDEDRLNTTNSITVCLHHLWPTGQRSYWQFHQKNILYKTLTALGGGQVDMDGGQEKKLIRLDNVWMIASC